MQHEPRLAVLRAALPHVQAVGIRGAQVKPDRLVGPGRSGHGCCLSHAAAASGNRPAPAAQQALAFTNYANPLGGDMNWTTPAYTELRLGFEITMYIANR
ncbi:hypothetical protein GCM10009079_04270 [Ralstonia mannitolilytica]